MRNNFSRKLIREWFDGTLHNQSLNEVHLFEGLFDGAPSFIAKGGIGPLMAIVKPGASLDSIKGAIDDLIKKYDNNMETVARDMKEMAETIDSTFNLIVRAPGAEKIIPKDPALNIEAYETILSYLSEKGMNKFKDAMEALKAALVTIIEKLAKMKPESALAKDKDAAINSIKSTGV